MSGHRSYISESCLTARSVPSLRLSLYDIWLSFAKGLWNWAV
ncbi:Uncharacterised protein [Mycobacteroides abscessus subsp. abscessus]|nr:Uncharacterised protein [Mycobacteroides abscessus subsp. abscessus]SHX25182.1 Uncharacterised protein [Mycobacteroides abscessus subsp. abscessus]SKU87423.1 Uncharacterised protein [Mycobacteroides abscessus subsp. abscessus]